MVRASLYQEEILKALLKQEFQARKLHLRVYFTNYVFSWLYWSLCILFHSSFLLSSHF